MTGASRGGASSRASTVEVEGRSDSAWELVR